MNTHRIAYDILELADNLKKAGVKDEIIQAQVKYEKARDIALKDDLATKHDIELLRKDITWIKVGGSVLGVVIVVGFAVLGLLITSQ